ncbi:NAD-dependent epimerase/dehydratase family protein [Salinibacterium sp. NYA9b]
MTTTQQLHVVLGGNGVIGRETIRALLRRGEKIASVGRRPSTIDGVSSITANLLTAADVAHALTGAQVAYLTAGLAYSSTIWAQQWPIILRNSIDAAITNNTHLIYFDNVYAYGLVDGPMTELSALRPVSKKGRIRADALTALHTAKEERGLSFTVARSADFYGPEATTSAFNTFALAKIAAGKPASWLFDADQPHSLTYTPDIGESLAILGTRPADSGNTWHIPTAPALTGREYLHLAGAPDSRINVTSATTLRIGALFNTAARETLEMSYQYTAPYLFDSTAFETVFGISPTPITAGITTSFAAERASS